jgi:hypothetical protein
MHNSNESNTTYYLKRTKHDCTSAQYVYCTNGIRRLLVTNKGMSGLPSTNRCTGQPVTPQPATKTLGIIWLKVHSYKLQAWRRFVSNYSMYLCSKQFGSVFRLPEDGMIMKRSVLENYGCFYVELFCTWWSVAWIAIIHSVFCLTTGPKPLPKRFHHTVQSRASSFKWEYPLLS